MRCTFLPIALVIAIIPASLIAGDVREDSRKVDLLLVNGNIYTGDERRPWAQSLAIADGSVISTGSDEEMKVFRVNAESIKDLGGRTVIPGLVDDHVHLLPAAIDMLGYRCNFSVYSDVEAILRRVAECAEAAEPGEWIIGEYWSSALIPDLSTPEAFESLEKAANGHPVMLGDDTTHNRWVSGAAMRIAGVDADTPDPDGGHIVRDDNRNALGVFVERPAANLIENSSPLADLAEKYSMRELIRLSVAKLNSYGVTSFQDARITDPAIAQAYQSLDDAGELDAVAALSTVFDKNNLADPAAVMNTAARASSLRVHTKYAKVYLDGVMTTRTAAFVEPYLPTPEGDGCFRGGLKISEADLAALVVRLDAMGVTVKLHAAGDASVRAALDAVQVARTLNGDNGPMHQIAHAGYVQDDDLRRFVTLRVAADASPTVWFPGPIATATAKQIGAERAYRYWPFKTMSEMGVLIAGGTDWKTLPEEQSDIWSGIQGMVTREDPSGNARGKMWPEQALTVEQAVFAYTLGSATALGLKDRIGSLEPGKSANLVILDRDIFSIPSNQIAQTKVIETIFEGRSVYQMGMDDPIAKVLTRLSAPNN